MMGSVAEVEQAFADLRALVPDLPDTAAVRTWRCSTCARCTDAFGMRSILDPGFDRERDGGYHIELEFDGTPRVFGGRTASAIGRTDDEAWANLTRSLS